MQLKYACKTFLNAYLAVLLLTDSTMAPSKIGMHTYARHLTRIRGNVNAEWYQCVGKKKMPPEKMEVEEDENGTRERNINKVGDESHDCSYVK